MSNSPHIGLLVGYARTSTTEQEAGLQAQVRDLRAAGCTKIFQEQVSSIAERAELERALDYVRAGDTLVVTKVDRLARSTAGLAAFFDGQLQRCGAGAKLHAGAKAPNPASRPPCRPSRSAPG